MSKLMLILALIFAPPQARAYEVEATAYSWGCGATNLTKSETWPIPLFTVAADPRVFPMGTLLRISGPFIGDRVWRVEDTGEVIVGRRIDLMVSNCRHAEFWGKRKLRVVVVGHATIPKRRR